MAEASGEELVTVAAACICFVLFFLRGRGGDFYRRSTTNVEGQISIVLWLAALASPMLAIGGAILLLPRKRAAAITLCVTAALVALPTIFVYGLLSCDRSFTPHNGWNGLVFLVLPILQWIATLPLLIIAAIIAYWPRKPFLEPAS